jgi:hypothetical protein
MGRTCSVHRDISVCTVSIGNPEGKGLLGRPRLRWEDNIREIVLGSMDWFNLIYDRDRQRTSLNTAVNLRLPYRRAISRRVSQEAGLLYGVSVRIPALAQQPRNQIS